MLNIQDTVLWLCWLYIIGTRGVEAQNSGDENGGISGNGGGGFLVERQLGGGNTTAGGSNRDNNNGGGSDGGGSNGAVSNDGNNDGGGANDGNESGGSSNNNDGRRRFGHRNKNGFRNGGRFRKGGGDNQQQDNGQTPDGQDDGDGSDGSGQLAASSLTISSVTSAIAPVDPPNFTTSSPTLSSEATISLVAAPDTESSFEQPTSVADVFPEPQSTLQSLVGIPYVVPPSSTTFENLSSFFAPEPTPFLPSALPLTTSKLTITTSMTIYVTESTIPLATSVLVEEDTSAPAQATQASSLDLAPLSTSSVKTLSAGEKAGMGIGVTLALLLIGGVVAYELHRRRKAKQGERLGSETGSQTASRRRLTLTDFFRSKDDREPKNDPEWSIESASKVSMVRAGSVKSVVSHTRSISPPLPVFVSSGSSSQDKVDGELELVKVGMKVPDRKLPMGLASMALRSNPPVSPSAFPSPPGAEKPGSWPLSS